MRCVRDGAFVTPAQNIGIRLETHFVNDNLARSLEDEARSLAADYGYEYDGDTRVHTIDNARQQETREALRVNNTRVTGRFEKHGQALPPWGYGDEFVRSALPPAISSLADCIESCGHYALGPLRDVTLNLRRHSFFQLDPHVDPLSDGPNVFVLSLLSSVVTTFTPPEQLARDHSLEYRREPHEVGLRSWCDADIDVLVQPCTLLHFSGEARTTWRHAIRAGVEAPLPEGGSVVCDWWGKTDYLLRRSDERISIVLAFGGREA